MMMTQRSPCQLFSMKQGKNESVCASIKRFYGMALRCFGGMDKHALVENCRHNFQIPILTQIGVAKTAEVIRGICRKVDSP